MFTCPYIYVQTYRTDYAKNILLNWIKWLVYYIKIDLLNLNSSLSFNNYIVRFDAEIIYYVL